MEEATPSVKDELEREKLRLEIAELKRRWWWRASTITAFLPPLTVALVGTLLGVAVGKWTGFFDIQRMELSAQRHNLEAQNRDLKAEEKGLIGKRAELLGQVAQLESERDTARRERDTARNERDGIATNLRDEQAKAAQKIAGLNSKVAEARELARRTPVVVWLDVLKRKTEPWQIADTSNAAEELLAVLNQEPSLVPLVASEYEKLAADDFVASKLLRVLYTATGETRWLEKMAAKLAEPPKTRNPSIATSLYPSVRPNPTENQYWRESTLLRLRKGDLAFLEKVLKLVPSGSADRRRTVLSLAGSFGGELGQRAFGSEESYFLLLRLARDEALVRNQLSYFTGISPSMYSSLSYERQQALRVIGRMNAEGTIAIFALLITTAPEPSPPSPLTLPGSTAPITITSPSLQSSERTQLETDFRYRLSDKAFRAEAVRLGVIKGESDVPQWRDWVRDNQSLVAEWTEPALAKVKQRLSSKTRR